MKRKATAILMILIYLNLAISYSVEAISVQEVIDKIYIEKDDKIYKEIVDINYEEDILKNQKFYEFLQEEYNISFESTDDVDEDFVEKNLELLNEFVNYLNKEGIMNELVDDSFQEEFENSNREDGENDGYSSSFSEEILEDNSILVSENNNSGDESNSIFQEHIDFDESYTISNIEDNDYECINNEINLDKYKSNINNLDDETLVVDDLLQDNIISKSILPYNNKNYINHEEQTGEGGNELDLVDLENKKDNNSSSNIKVNISDLEITKNSNEELKITFKIDNDLDLKEDQNDLKIYIGNNTKGKEILLTKNKALNKYLYLENITSISGEILELGKDDTLLGGVYTVILSDEEQKKLKDVGLENLIVKVEADFNNKSSSVVGYLKKEESSYDEDIKKDEDKNSLSVISSNNNESSVKNSDNAKNTLPKTGVVVNNILVLFGETLLVLLGIFLLKYKKIEP
ncbi:MAG: LPXTG cell wall anchor domain-containing protein [Clostridium perfringens]|nr:LPXTG cell wall anchor domain-containing protein [Clostridium perfringens]